MFGKGDTQVSLPPPVRYRLPVTVVRLWGTQTTTTSDLEGVVPQVGREGAVDLSVVADEQSGALHQLVFAGGGSDGWKDRSFTVKLHPDGRLLSVGGTAVDRSGARMKAIVSVGGTLLALGAAAGALVVGGPAGGLVAGGLLTTVATGAVARQRLHLQPDDLPGSADGELTDEQLGIHAGYATARSVDHSLLRRYRLAAHELAVRHVDAARTDGDPVEVARALAALGRALESVRAEGRVAEERYAAWLAGHETTEVVHVDVFLRATDVPTEDELEDALRDEEAKGKERASSKGWWPAAEALRTMATIDLLDELPKAPAGPVDPGSVVAGSIVVRRPRPAQLAIWKLAQDATTKRWTKTLERRERILVTRPGTEEAVVVVPAFSGSTSATIDDGGGIVDLAHSITSRAADRAEAIAGLPAALKEGVESGSTVATTLSPTALRAARLEQLVKIQENEAKLAPAAADPERKALEEALAEAELEARLRVAEQVRDNPSSVAVVFRREE